MSRRAFERLVRQVIASLPSHVLARLDNVAILVRDEPDPHLAEEVGTDLLGVYLGVSLTERAGSYGMVEPDRIILFQKALEAEAGGNPTRLRREVKRTLIHEIAHYFGIDDDSLVAWNRY